MARGLWKIGSSRRQSRVSTDNSNPSGTITPVTSEDGAEQGLTKQPSRLRKAFSSFKTDKATKADRAERAREDQLLARIHRPFSSQNLEHQRILNAFEWNFRRSSTGGRSSFSGVSPNASRHASIDSGYATTTLTDRKDSQPRYSNVLAQDVPHEVPGEESDRDPLARES